MSAVVYWGRWAGTTGDVGPLSATAVGWIEGGSPYFLPGGVGMTLGEGMGGRKAVQLIEDLREPAAAPDRTYVVAVLDAQLRSIVGQQAAPPELAGPAELPDGEQRLLEGPAEGAGVAA